MQSSSARIKRVTGSLRTPRLAAAPISTNRLYRSLWWRRARVRPPLCEEIDGSCRFGSCVAWRSSSSWRATRDLDGVLDMHQLKQEEAARPTEPVAVWYEVGTFFGDMVLKIGISPSGFYVLTPMTSKYPSIQISAIADGMVMKVLIFSPKSGIKNTASMPTR